MEFLLFVKWFRVTGMDPNYLEYPQYHFRDRIGSNSSFQPNRRCRFYDHSIGGGIVGVFCSFGRIYLDNLEPIVVKLNVDYVVFLIEQPKPRQGEQGQLNS